MRLEKVLEAKPHALYRAGGEVLDEDIRLCDHRGKDRLVRLVFQVKTYRFLAPVQPDEIGAVAIHQRIIPPGEIPLGALDLDHPRAGIGKPA